LFERVQSLIDGVPSGTRRIIIAAILLVLLAFLFPLSDDDRRTSFDGPTFPPETLLTPQPTLQAVDQSTGATEATTPPLPTRPGSVTPSSELVVTEECTLPDGWEVYVVRRGDTLAGIAQLVGMPVAELIEVNCLENPNRIDVNQQIWVPGLPSPFITATPRTSD
jgi:LysM repeat protein